MKKTNSIATVWDEVIQFNNEYFRGWRSVDDVFYSNALAGEVGEVCNTVKHRAGGGTKVSSPSIHDLMEELADVFIYLELLVEKQGLDSSSLADAVHAKILVNRTRMESTLKSRGTSREGEESMKDIAQVKKIFVKYLTEDSESQDMRRSEFNQAIFNKDDGWACYTDTDLSMVLDKFDMAVKKLKRIREEKKR